MLKRDGIILTGKFHQTCQNKEDCLYTELLNYVVLDSLLDFYNYELGVVMDEKDHDVIILAEFIMKVIMNFIRTKGQKWLQTPEESAGEQFDRYLQNEEYRWDRNFPDMMDDEIEGDEWKVNEYGPGEVMEAFQQAFEEEYRHYNEFRVAEKFKEFMRNYLELENIHELTFEDIQEFFLVVLVNEYLVVDEFDFLRAVEIFDLLVEFIAFSYDHSLTSEYHQFRLNVIPEIRRTFEISRNYQKIHPLVEFFISGESDNDTLLEGFFEVEEITTTLYNLRDIHLHTEFKGVSLERLRQAEIRKGDILHGQLAIKGSQWRLVHLEMVYPKYARPHLF